MPPKNAPSTQKTAKKATEKGATATKKKAAEPKEKKAPKQKPAPKQQPVIESSSDDDGAGEYPWELFPEDDDHESADFERDEDDDDEWYDDKHSDLRHGCFDEGMLRAMDRLEELLKKEHFVPEAYRNRNLTPEEAVPIALALLPVQEAHNTFYFGRFRLEDDVLQDMIDLNNDSVQFSDGFEMRFTDTQTTYLRDYILPYVTTGDIAQKRMRVYNMHNAWLQSSSSGAAFARDLQRFRSLQWQLSVHGRKMVDAWKRKRAAGVGRHGGGWWGGKENQDRMDEMENDREFLAAMGEDMTSDEDEFD